jgi:tRNA pseudouridine38-40 synthase
METYKAIIAYDGTDFQGFQRQAEGLRTVQGEIEAALMQLGWNEGSIKAAGRTDAGVHAQGQVISFALKWRATVDDLARALNANLPSDIAVKNTEKVESEFHPRFSAKKRLYIYHIVSELMRDPLKERYAWRVWPELNIDILSQAAKVLLGKHDFGAFGQAPTEGGHTIRTVFRANWSRTNKNLIFEIEADAFLYHMVRRLVGAQVSLGSDKLNLSEFEGMLKEPSRKWQGTLAPARGLILEMVTF